jgi:hypothetical protein
MKRLGILLFLFLGLGKAQGNESSVHPRFFKTIEDNSLLIEEAYNQEAGIVQHIFEFQYFPTAPKDFFLIFTQEWPVGSQAHQLSYTIPASFLAGGEKGIGDVLLNYRYQLFDKNDAAAVAPRLSLIFPTGSVEKGIGFGTLGVQIDFPVSKRWTDHFITHFNVGGTFLPGAEQALPSGARAEKTLTFANLGISLGWLAHPHFNILLESVINFSSDINTTGEVDRFTQFILNPFLRGSIDVGSLEIVPGLGVPLQWTGGHFEPSLFFYLSFEHPFMKTKS